MHSLQKARYGPGALTLSLSPSLPLSLSLPFHLSPLLTHSLTHSLTLKVASALIHEIGTRLLNGSASTPQGPGHDLVVTIDAPSSNVAVSPLPRDLKSASFLNARPRQPVLEPFVVFLRRGGGKQNSAIMSCGASRDPTWLIVVLTIFCGIGLRVGV